MPNKCFVPGCRSGYKSCTDKVSLFKPPLEPLLLQKWQRAIPRADRLLCERDRVCELHFAPHLIERAFCFKVGDEVSELQRDRPRLVEGAIPHLFPNCPAYLSKKVTSKRKIHDKSSQQSLKKLRLEAESSGSTSQHLSQSDPQMMHESHSDKENCLTFEALLAESSTLCPVTWNTVCVNTDFVCFGKLDIVDGQMMVISSVSVSKSMNAQVYYKGKPVPTQGASFISSRRQLIALFTYVDLARECIGNPDPHLLKAISHSRIGLLDSCGVWRNKNCTHLTLNAVRCKPCMNFRRTLQSAAPRNRVLKKLRSDALRLRTVHRLQKRVSICKVMAARLKKQLKDASNVKIDEFVKDLPTNQQLAVRHCFRQLKVKSSKGMRYSNHWILNCLLLRIKSPKAYSHLRDHCFLSLPSLTTLSRYIDVVHAETGVSNEMISLLGNKLKQSSKCHGILIFDEVHLREGLRFSSKILEFEGLVDFGEFTPQNCKNQLANTALVFMYRPILDGWVQTVGMFLSKGPTPASILSKLLLKLIIALESHGLWVDGLVSDGSCTNRGVWKEFGISGSQDCVCNSVQHPLADVPGFQRDQDRLYFFSDYVHLFKCIRNNLLNRRVFKFSDGDVIMGHFVDLLRLDSCHGGLRAVPKLTSTHVEPNNFQRMNVKMAVQLFSNSVADGLSFYKSHGAAEFQNADSTISFVRRMNRLFDVLNAKQPSTGLRINTDNMTFLEDCLCWLDSWEIYAKGPSGDRKKFLSPSTAAGLRVTLHSTLQLSQFLLKSDFQYVLTSRFSQDPLEHFFGLIRHAGGCDDHPTTVMFMSLYRLLSVYSLLRLPKRQSGFINQLGVSLPLPSAANKTQTKRTNAVAISAECLDSLAAFVDDESDSDIDPSEIPQPVTNTAKDGIIFYVAGFVVRRMKKILDCEICITRLLGDPNPLGKGALVGAKLRGALHWPSDALFNSLRDIENILSVYTADRFHPSMFSSIIEESLPALLPLKSVLCVSHSSMVAAEILIYYVSTRLHWHAKSVTRGLITKKQTKNHRKKAKLC